MRNRHSLRLVAVAVFAGMCFCHAVARDYEIKGPEGGIAFRLTLPEGFDPGTERCPMVILMHGIFASKDFIPMPSFARGLAKAGIASIRFDFDGHGGSEGRMQDMTVEKEIADAMAVWEYVKSLPYVSKTGILGHSQGGVVAAMTAGILAAGGDAPDAMVLVASGSVIKDACRNGKFFNAEFDPADPPEYIRCFGAMKLGRDYLVSTQDLDIYGTAADYHGPVLLLHGDRDGIVPMWCSEKFREVYGERSELIVVEGENHTITNRRGEVVALGVGFFREILSGHDRND